MKYSISLVMFVICFIPSAYSQRHNLRTGGGNKTVTPVLIEPYADYDIAKYISDRINYPEMAKEANIQGRVIVQFWVDEAGAITNVKILWGIGGGCDEEALRIVNTLPKWKPGTYAGKPTKMRYTLPISFRRNY